MPGKPVNWLDKLDITEKIFDTKFYDVDNMLRYLWMEQRMTQKEIGDIIGVSYSSVQRRCSKLGIKREVKTRFNPETVVIMTNEQLGTEFRSVEEVLKYLYLDKKMTIVDILKIFLVSHPTISKRLKAMGIKIRPHRVDHLIKSNGVVVGIKGIEDGYGNRKRAGVYRNLWPWGFMYVLAEGRKYSMKVTLSNQFWLNDAFTQRVTKREWAWILLHELDMIVIRGRLRKLEARHLGVGVYEIYVGRSLEEDKQT